MYIHLYSFKCNKEINIKLQTISIKVLIFYRKTCFKDLETQQHQQQKRDNNNKDRIYINLCVYVLKQT